MSEKSIELEYEWDHQGNWPFNGIVNDLWRGIQAEENYLVGLGLFAYSEFIGRLILGTIGQSGGGPDAYRAFTEQYVGYSFTDQEWQEIFDRCRNGFAHEFFIKQGGSSALNEDGSSPCGIELKADGTIAILVHSYFRHFVGGLTKMLGAGFVGTNT